MNHANLLPPARHAAKVRRRATRRWAVVNSVYALLLATAGVVFAYNRAAAPLPPTTDVGRLNAVLVNLRQQAATFNTQFKSVSEVSDQADWSVLLSLLADLLGDDVVLSAVDTTTPGTTPAAAATSPRRFVMTGVGRSLPAVTQYVLRVEHLKLFTQVRLTQTVARPLRGIEGVGFQIVCTLPGGGQ